jgi:hypothetical protein
MYNTTGIPMLPPLRYCVFQVIVVLGRGEWRRRQTASLAYLDTVQHFDHLAVLVHHFWVLRTVLLFELFCGPFKESPWVSLLLSLADA